MIGNTLRLIGILPLLLVIVYGGACGQTKLAANNPAHETNTTNSAIEDAPQEPVASIPAPVVDVPRNPNSEVPNDSLEPASIEAAITPDPLMSRLPYFCDPRHYAPNVIENNRACDPFRPIPYVGFGLDRSPPIGYRLKHGVGRIGDDDDDDDGRRRGKWNRWTR